MQGYLVSTSQLDFQIQINIQSTNSSITQTLLLDPAQPFVVNDDGSVAAQLLGDLMSYTSMPDFSSYILMIPSPAGNIPRCIPSSDENTYPHQELCMDFWQLCSCTLQHSHKSDWLACMSGAGLTPDQVLSSNQSQWMMVPQSMVSIDGTQCNMVGTSYYAFRYQTVSTLLPHLWNGAHKEALNTHTGRMHVDMPLINV
jgi:hypothetical protein